MFTNSERPGTDTSFLIGWGPITTMLNELSSLAREKCPEKRKELLSAVADLFLHSAQTEPNVDGTVFQDVVTRLLDDMDAGGGADFSRKMASSQHTPVAVAERLAHDEDIAVAGPVLRESPVLPEALLQNIAQLQSQAHLQEISQREHISESVTDIIVDRGNRDVVRTVASNSGAQFSEQGFERMAQKSKSDETLAVHLFRRSDVPAAVTDKLLEDLPQELKSRLERLAAVDSATASTLLHKATKVAKDKGRREAASVARTLVASVKSGKSSIDEVVTNLAQATRSIELAMVLSELANIPAQEVQGVLNRTDLTAIAVVCKQLEVSHSAFESLASMIGRQLSLPDSHIAHFANQYDGLDVDVAARVSRFVSVRRKFAQ